MRRLISTTGVLCLLLLAGTPASAQLAGTVRGGGVLLPGAALTATQGATTRTTLSGDEGRFAFADLAAGAWTVQVSMTGFEPESRTVHVPAADLDIVLKVAPLEASAVPAPAPATPPSNPQGALAVNGSVDNAATSAVGISPAFGNHRPSARALYNGAFGLAVDTSALDARPYSLSGAFAPKPRYGDLTGMLQFGGPLRLLGLTSPTNPPFFFAAYEKSSSLRVTTTSALVPTTSERTGAGIDPQAAALLDYYPLPNLPAGGPYNFQTSLPSREHTDRLQVRVSQNLGFGNQISGGLSLASTRGDTASLFGFRDGSSSLGLNANLSWRHALTRTLFATAGVQFSRLATREEPFFSGRRDVAGAAGIVGGDSNPLSWGPPGLNFSNGLASLGDVLPSDNRNQTVALSLGASWDHENHNVTFGADVRRLQFNLSGQQNPRGTFTFNGAATGDALGDFLAGRPDAVSLGFGNGDKYFRQWNQDLYVADDWRVSDSVSLNLGARWEYASPASERYGRLANLEVGAGFQSARQVLGGTGDALVRPDRSGLEPRLGLAWRPFATSSLLLRAGYGMYRDTAAYEALALQLAQQAPFATTVSVQASAGAPLSLASGLTARPGPGATPELFAVDPNFRVGYAQSWNASAQADVTAGYVATLSTLGTKGTHGAQRFYPNTEAPGAAEACPSCPSGFLYLTSGGSSSYESATAKLQRRFHNGLAGTVAYTYSRAYDDAALGGERSSAAAVAQDWRDLGAEWARSDFDQRHVLSVQGQYSTGRRWRTTALRGWTMLADLKAGSGMPFTPATLIPVPGTGFFGVRPDPIAGGGFAAPMAGQWGTAKRNSLAGPSQFTLNASLQREFDLPHGLTAALRLDANNLLNHAAAAGLDGLYSSPQFLLPVAMLPMRSVRTSLRVTF